MDILKNIDLIGTAGLLIAAYTFYRTQIKKAKIEIVSGPTFEVYYLPNGSTGIYLPMAFINEMDVSGKVIIV
jgi:hypothetical protein